MADNVTVDNGDLSDYSVSTDDAGADGQVQRVKIAYAADGSATHVPADANGLLVNLGANNDVTVTGTVTATDGGSTLSIDDGGASLTVDGTVAVSGTVAVTQSGVWDEVGINDSGNSITVDDGGGSLTVDGTVGVSGTVTVDSELPAAVALADNAGNPTAPAVGAFGMVWDGSTWDRAPGTSADGALVNLGANNDVVISDGGGSITVDGTVSVTEPVSVDDNGASLTVDAPVGTPVNVQVGDGTRTASVRDTGSSDSLNVAIVDASGNQITSFGGAGGTSETDEAAFTASSTAGTPVMGARDDSSPDTLAEGTVGIIRSTTNRALHVNLRDASGNEVSVGGGTQYAEDGASAGGEQLTLAGAVRRDTAASSSATDGDYSTLNTDASGRLWVNASGAAVPVTDNGGTLTVDDGGSSLTVDGTVALSAGSANIGDVDVLTVPAPLSTSGGGTEASALRVTIASDSTGLVSVDDNGGSLTVDGSVSVSALPASTNTLEVVGDAAHDAAAAGNPVLEGGYASAAAPADVSADGDAVRGWRLRNGAAATVITAAGALIPGDAANGLDVDVTRLPALPAGTNNIGDVDVLTVPAPLSTTGGGTEATALRVTVATDSTGVLSVDDNGGSLTVDGTVAVSALPASTNTLEVVGDAAHDAAASGNPVLIGAEFDDAATDGVDEGDVGRLRISANRNLYSTIRDAAGNERGANVNASNQLSVSVDNTVTVASHAVTNAGTFATQESGAALTALQLLDDTIVADDAAFTVATTKTSVAGFLADETSTDSVDEGDAGAARMTLDRKLISVNQPHTAGGCSIFRSLDLDESEEEVKASAGCVYGYYIANLATSTRFVKFYNATAASVTVGSTTPVMTLPIPGNSTDDVGANLLGGVGITFDTAITVAATTGIADSDTGAPGANEVVINLFYK